MQIPFFAFQIITRPRFFDHTVLIPGHADVPSSPPCPDICLETTEYCCTDSAAFREMMKCELNKLLTLLEEERCCAIQQYQQSDMMLAQQREYCAQVLRESHSKIPNSSAQT
jgi:hypothetical protein